MSIGQDVAVMICREMFGRPLNIYERSIDAAVVAHRLLLVAASGSGSCANLYMIAIALFGQVSGNEDAGVWEHFPSYADFRASFLVCRQTASLTSRMKIRFVEATWIAFSFVGDYGLNKYVLGDLSAANIRGTGISFKHTELVARAREIYGPDPPDKQTIAAFSNTYLANWVVIDSRKKLDKVASMLDSNDESFLLRFHIRSLADFFAGLCFSHMDVTSLVSTVKRWSRAYHKAANPLLVEANDRCATLGPSGASNNWVCTTRAVFSWGSFYQLPTRCKIFICNDQGDLLSWLIRAYDKEGCLATFLRNAFAAGLLGDEESLLGLDEDTRYKVSKMWTQIAISIEGVSHNTVACKHLDKYIGCSFLDAREMARSAKTKTEHHSHVREYILEQSKNRPVEYRYICPACGSEGALRTFVKEGLLEHMMNKHPWFVTRVSPFP
jgi:hypothetical protein